MCKAFWFSVAKPRRSFASTFRSSLGNGYKHKLQKQISDADLAKMVHDLNKCEAEGSRIDWYMAERKAMASKKKPEVYKKKKVKEKDEKP